jgi:hypothetical protein
LLTPVRVAPADDPTHSATIRVDTNQNLAAYLPDRPDAQLPVIPPVIDLLDNARSEHRVREVEG